MTIETPYMNPLSLIFPRTTTYEDVLLVNWPRWPHYRPLLTTGTRCTLLMPSVSVPLNTHCIWVKPQHLCEGGVTISWTSALWKECVTAFFLLDLLFFLSSTPWRRSRGLIWDWTIMDDRCRHFSARCWFLHQNSIFFYVLNDAQCLTRRRTYCGCSRCKWAQVPWWGLQMCTRGAACFYFCVFPFILFQNRLPLEDRTLKLLHLYFSQNIKRISCILSLTPSYSLFWNTITSPTLMSQNEASPSYSSKTFLDNQTDNFQKNIGK